MYFKVKDNTETYSRFEELYKRMKTCGKAAFDLAKSLGFEKIAIPLNSKCGGVKYFYCPGEVPEGFKMIGPRSKRLVYPKKSNKTVLNQINDLPIVSEQEFNDIINYKCWFGDSTFYRSYGLFRRGSDYYLNVKFKNNKITCDDLEEVLESEWIKKVINKEK